MDRMSIVYVRHCQSCDKTKPLTEFYEKYKGSGQYHSHCSACTSIASKVYRRNNKHKVNKWASDAHKRRVIDRVDWKLRLVAMFGGKCVDCGYDKHVVAMDFDHLDPTEKRTEVAGMMNGSYSWESIVEEAKKCELVCANCHRVRTHERRAAKRLVTQEQKAA